MSIHSYFARALKPPSRLRFNRVASVQFLLTAVGPIGMWLTLLFDEIPTKWTHLTNAAQMLTLIFAAHEQWWIFALRVLLPVILLGLAVMHWRRVDQDVPRRMWLTGLGLGASVVALLVIHWSIGLSAVLATYYGYKCVQTATSP
jgi:hypothetical protein